MAPLINSQYLESLYLCSYKISLKPAPYLPNHILYAASLQPFPCFHLKTFCDQDHSVFRTYEVKKYSEVGHNFFQLMVENLFGTPGTLFSSKPAIFHPCGCLPLLLSSFPKLSSPDQISCKSTSGKFTEKLLVMKSSSSCC